MNNRIEQRKNNYLKKWNFYYTDYFKIWKSTMLYFLIKPNNLFVIFARDRRMFERVAYIDVSSFMWLKS